MTKNRTAQLMFQSAFCAIGIIGVIASFGFFDMVWRWDFYIQFTNISNYMCVGIMIAELVQTAKKKENSFVTVAPVLKFVGVLSILLTFIVFNFFIANESTRDPVLNYKINSVTFHVILPIMYILDWFLFYERKKVKVSYPSFPCSSRFATESSFSSTQQFINSTPQCSTTTVRVLSFTPTSSLTLKPTV